jgi:hypothetical protein
MKQFDLLKKYKTEILIVLFVNIICYFYLFTEHIFTNHTIPEIFATPFPSYVTKIYGRWMSDIITNILGGVGIQPVGVLISTLFTVINATILMKIFRTESKALFAIAALLLTLGSERYDILCFSSVSYVHAIADFFVLLGTYFFLDGNTKTKKYFLASLLYIFAIACTQIKIPFIFLMIGIGIIYKTQQNTSNEKSNRQLLLNLILTGSFLIISSLAVYYVTYSICIPGGITTSGRHDYRNTIPEILNQIKQSYPLIISYYSKTNSYLPNIFSFLPLLTIIASFTCILYKSFKKSVLIFLISLLILSCLPILMNIIYIINIRSGAGGRFYIHYNYLLTISALILLKTIKEFKNPSIWKYTYWGGLTIAMIIIYFSGTLALQRTNYYYHKGKQEEMLIQRILTRIEPKLDLTATNRYSLIVIGRPKTINQNSFINKNIDHRISAHFHSNSFEIYRQPQILNYFFGQDIFNHANKNQAKSLVPIFEQMEPWPSDNSIKVIDNTVIVSFEKYFEGVTMTWTID